MAAKVMDINSNKGWEAFEKVFGSNDGYESRFALPRRWDGKDIYSDLDKLLIDYMEKIREHRPELEEKAGNVCGRVREMLRLYLHGYPSDAYYVMKKLMAELEEDPLYVSSESIGSLYRMSSVSENTDDKPRIFHAPYTIRPKIRTYRYSIAGYPSLYLAESLSLAEEEMHLFRDKKPAIAARFEFDEEFAKGNSTKILEFGFRPQELAAVPEPDKDDNDGNEAERPEENGQKKEPRAAFVESVHEADKIREKEEEKKRSAGMAETQSISAPGGSAPGKKSLLSAQNRYMVWYPLIAACSYVRTNREDPFAPEYIVPQLLTQWMRSENTGELVGIRYFSCYSRHASEKGCNYVFPTSGDPIILKDGVKPYCPVLNEAFAFTGTEYLPEYTDGVKEMEEALKKKRAERAFHLTSYDFKNASEAELPAELMYLAARSFMNCKKLKTVKNLDNVVSIGDGAFAGCTGLNLTKLPEGLTSIGDGAFFGCTGLKLTKLPEGLTSIGVYAFRGCTGLKLTKLPEGLTNIGLGAFFGCTGLERMTLPEGLTNIGLGAFGECTGLKLIELHEGLTSIGVFAFRGCTGLRLIKLPEGLTSIGNGAFYGCESISEITLPKGLKIIGSRVFIGCAGLRNIHYSGTKEVWKDIDKSSIWDDGVPEGCRFHFADGEEMSMDELRAFEGHPIRKRRRTAPDKG